MPYSSVSEIPDYVKKKTTDKKKRRQWLHVFNAVYGKTHSEARAFAAAKSLVAASLAACAAAFAASL